MAIWGMEWGGKDAIISRRRMKYIVSIYKQGFVTRSTQHLMRVSYNSVIWGLRDGGVIREEGIDTNNHQKRWVLTEKGRKMAEHISELYNLIGVFEGDGEEEEK